MSIEAGEFLLEAEKSLDSENCSEVTFRNAGSRAYYAIYHKALNKANEIDADANITEKTGTHDQLAIRLERHSHRGKIFATKLRRLKRTRNRCDYNLNEDIDKEFAEQHIHFVKKALEDLKYIK